MANWQVTAGSLGPQQTKLLKEAIRNLQWQHKNFVQVTGVVGDADSEHRTLISSPFEPLHRDDVDKAEAEIQTQFSPVNKLNYKAVIQALNEATVVLQKAAPIRDERITPEVDVERTARTVAGNAARTARDAQQAELREKVRQLAPTGTKAVIVAELQKDKSDPMTDYFANETVRSVAIGFRLGSREDFAQLGQRWKAFPETNAKPYEERRDNHSMGAGNYLTDHGSANSGSGWIVKSYPLDSNYWHITEIWNGLGMVNGVDLPIYDGQPATKAKPAKECNGVVQSVTPGTKTGQVCIKFTGIPPVNVRDDLKAHHFRWDPKQGVWSGYDVSYAHGLKMPADTNGLMAAVDNTMTKALKDIQQLLGHMSTDERNTAVHRIQAELSEFLV